jgi:SAM-dependent methyltransferase
MTTPGSGHTNGHPHHGRAGPAEWDARYGEDEHLWSGRPNHALTVEAAALTPGRALDVGCGEGADAVWLAARGWRVTGLDPSSVALARARAAAEAAGVEVTWVHASLEEATDDAVPDSGFDLVIAFYAPLFRDTDPVAALARRVAPSGTLLVVHHAEVDRERARAHGIDPDDLLSPDDVPAALGAGWTLQAHERRGRAISGGAGAHHRDDLVVRARRAP